MPITRRSFVQRGAAAALSPLVSAQTGRKPNILFIVLDDLGYGELGCYGQKQSSFGATARSAARRLRCTRVASVSR
jgi:arylsulfatase